MDILNLNTWFDTTSKKIYILNFLTQGAARALHVQPLLAVVTKVEKRRPNLLSYFGNRLFSLHHQPW